MMQLSGMSVTYDLARPVGSRAVRMTVNGSPLELTRSYIVATSSFLGAGGDLYEAFTRGEHLTVGTEIAPIFEAWLRKHGPAAIEPATSWRPTRSMPAKVAP
jgi:2',3'-cyclic-nucleotide 2'-phosphodiesterase (5'-nucleotidase family)